MAKKSNNILFSCAGLGMGNAARVVAIVEALLERARESGQAVSITVVSWGAGYAFLEKYRAAHSSEWNLVRARDYAGLFSWPRAYALNVALMRSLVRKLSPGMIVLDSDYHFPAYLLAGCPVVYIGQAHDVLERARTRSLRLGTLRARVNFFLRERLDAFLQNCFSTFVLVPSFESAGSASGKFTRIPLIVRKEFLDTPLSSNELAAVGLLLSGSQLEQESFEEFASGNGLEILARVPSRVGALDRFGVVFTQGGLSSISECIARSKFLVVVPLKEHPEQMLNAMEVEQLGLGMRSSLEELRSLPDLLLRVRSMQASVRSRVDCRGAEVAAGRIWGELAAH